MPRKKKTPSPTATPAPEVEQDEREQRDFHRIYAGVLKRTSLEQAEDALDLFHALGKDPDLNAVEAMRGVVAYVIAHMLSAIKREHRAMVEARKEATAELPEPLAELLAAIASADMIKVVKLGPSGPPLPRPPFGPFGPTPTGGLN